MTNQLKDIYIIRHGETDFNKQGIVQGSGVDASLNQLGQKQADAFYNHYKHIYFDKIYTSTLKRTHQSVAKFLKKDENWDQHYGLNEISWGIREGKLPNSADQQYYQNLIESWQNGQVELRCEGGESPIEVAERQQLFLKEMVKNSDEKTILIAMHGRAMRILFTQLFENKLQQMDEYEHSNLCLYVIQYDYNSKKFALVVKNSIEHLKNL